MFQHTRQKEKQIFITVISYSVVNKKENQLAVIYGDIKKRTKLSPLYFKSNYS